ncbi:Hypothetical predicted protein [Lecanosticta acicola]|uniref:JmjC domain-containing protein n=1 Tax=Lecanosticta acicola TaxID=111012 RepID=A0AAI8Z8I2_9PEZI|nr:Hypothetical predicted protein [Lecanosticta acicola]
MDPIESFISLYNDLNPPAIDQLVSPPTTLQFMRYVARNRPFVVRSGAKHWAAVKKWDASYLRQKLQGLQVRVALTPQGNADAVVQDEGGRLLFAEPYEVQEPFGDFLDYIQNGASEEQEAVKYAQPQNDSLRLEYPILFPDVPDDISFFTQALETEIDGINFWLGNDRSTTSLHKDNYENCYVQIRGQKHFTLLPPVCMPCVNETALPFARFDRSLNPAISPGEPIPVPIWDPDEPQARATKYSPLAQPLRVTLHAGDMMYLPAMWYHKVRQGNGPEGFSCSVNYWYDMDFSGHFWTSNAFVRDVLHAKAGEVDYPDLDLDSK